MLRQYLSYSEWQSQGPIPESHGPKDAYVSDLDTIAPNRLLRESVERVVSLRFTPELYLRLNRLWECVSQHRLSLSGRTPLLSVHSFGGLVPYEPTA